MGIRWVGWELNRQGERTRESTVYCLMALFIKKEVNLKSEWVLIPLFALCAATSRG